MTVQAQNALLKTIEEPPAYAVILLLTTNQDAFLPTILSRCVPVSYTHLDVYKRQEGIWSHPYGGAGLQVYARGKGTNP